MNNRAFASEPFIQLWCMISAGRIDTVLDDLNGMALRLPLRHRAPALIFVCQQWHAISSRGAGTKTQVLILSALMVLMARRMSETACHWKCNAAYGMTSRNDSRNMMFNEISRCTVVSTGESTGAVWVQFNVLGLVMLALVPLVFACRFINDWIRTFKKGVKTRKLHQKSQKLRSLAVLRPSCEYRCTQTQRFGPK